MSDITPDKSQFNFMGLPTELRLMVYTHLVVSPNGKRIHLVDEACRKRSMFNIQTGILYASRQTYAEACPLLYAKNKLDIIVSPCQPYYPKDRWLCRKDIYPGGRRSLRSGREVNTMTYIGVIYPHVLARFLDINVRFEYTPQHYWGIEYQIEDLLEVLVNLAEHDLSKERANSSLFSVHSRLFSLEVCKIMCGCPGYFHEDLLLHSMRTYGVITAMKELQKYRKVLAISSKAKCYSDPLSVELINAEIME